jgi:radical SAM protein with 4Fe4S-binding SPASM domain
MHVAVLPSSSALHAEAAALAASGRLRSGSDLTSPHTFADSLGPDDHAILPYELARDWLVPLTNRCRAGALAAVHLVVTETTPHWDDIGFRVRPWVQGIYFVGPSAPAAPRGTAPAPLLRVPDLAAVIAAAERAAFAVSELPTAFPPKIQIETTAHCGLDCPFCPKSWQEPDRTRMSEALFERILRECGEGRPDSIELYLNGDPLTDPRLESLADVAKALSPSSLIEIITHERTINPRRAKRLAVSGLDAVFVSVNFTEPTAAEEVRRRLARIAEIRTLFRDNDKHLGVVVLWNLMDAATRAHFVAACAELELPFDRFRATTRMGDVDLDQFAHAERLTASSRFCERPFTKAYVRATGAVLLCCEDWEDRWVLGNVNDTPLAEIWASAVYRERRRSFIEGRLSAPCEGCEYIAPRARASGPGAAPTRAEAAPVAAHAGLGGSSRG